MGWNLPPGVELSDIPGNRPEDELSEYVCSKCEKAPDCELEWCAKHPDFNSIVQ